MKKFSPFLLRSMVTFLKMCAIWSFLLLDLFSYALAANFFNCFLTVCSSSILNKCPNNFKVVVLWFPHFGPCLYVFWFFLEYYISTVWILLLFALSKTQLISTICLDGSEDCLEYCQHYFARDFFISIIACLEYGKSAKLVVCLLLFSIFIVPDI